MRTGASSRRRGEPARCGAVTMGWVQRRVRVDDDPSGAVPRSKPHQSDQQPSGHLVDGPDPAHVEHDDVRPVADRLDPADDVLHPGEGEVALELQYANPIAMGTQEPRLASSATLVARLNSRPSKTERMVTLLRARDGEHVEAEVVGQQAACAYARTEFPWSSRRGENTPMPS